MVNAAARAAPGKIGSSAYEGFQQLRRLSSVDARAKLEHLQHEHFNQLWRARALREIKRLHILIENWGLGQEYMYEAEAPPAAAAGPSSPHGAPRARPTEEPPTVRRCCSSCAVAASVCACARPAGAEPTPRPPDEQVAASEADAPPPS